MPAHSRQSSVLCLIQPLVKCAGLVVLAGIALVSGGCHYMTAMGRQTWLSARDTASPSVQVRKHMLACSTAFVFGELRAASSREGLPLAVIALNREGNLTRPVDVCQGVRLGSYYGLNLPSGRYVLALAEDRNLDGHYCSDEVVAGRLLDIAEGTDSDRVLSEVHLECALAPGLVPEGLDVPVKAAASPGESVFFPSGSLRSLDDEIFAPGMSSLGLYEPAAFIERAPMMFYVLEEDNGGKVPVIFVHGINGSARDFEPLVSKMDRRRFKPWFFHYPSGMKLGQLSAMFHRIFLSGKVIPLEGARIVIVAHSMGGLVVRDALNLCTGSSKEPRVVCLITIASPLAGHPGAREAVHSPFVVPSWRDLDPGSDFVRRLHRRALPSATAYHLLYAFGNDGLVKLGENSDGVVPLSSQLAEAAQREARDQFGFNATHTGILSDPGLIARVLGLLEPIEPDMPADQLEVLRQGGYDLPLGPHYSRMEAVLIRNIGRFMDAMAEGRLQPANQYQKDFVEEAHGRKRPSMPASTAYLKLRNDFPDRAGR